MTSTTEVTLMTAVTSPTELQSTREVERKYEAADEVPLPDPSRLLGADNIGAGEDLQLDAVYFDTPDLRLLRAGVTLRRREGGADPGWHLKLPVGKDSREELRVPLGQARRTPPAELTALTRVHTRGVEVAPVVRLRTRRRRWQLADDEGRPLAELVEDRVTAHTLGSDIGNTTDIGDTADASHTSDTGDTGAMSWREVEVELSEHGSVALLDQVEQRLLDAGAQRSGAASKLSRVLADRLSGTVKGAEPDADRAEPDAGDSAGATVLAYLREQAGRLRRFDPLVRRDAPDSVHQMRVASRRLRSAVQAYRRVLDRDATRPLAEELKWLAGELAPARDSEVMAERFRKMVDQLPPELVLGPVSATLDRTFARRQAEARERALAALDSDRYLALHDALDALLAHPPLTERAGRPAQRELPSHVRRALRRMRRGMAVVDRQPGGEQRDLALHETRKAAKRLRYATEAAEPAVGQPARRLRKRLKPVQNLLGDHQDSVVARPVLREFGAQAHLDGGNGFTFGLLYGTETARADHAEQRLTARWKRMTKPKNTRWLGRSATTPDPHDTR
jgi:CHAD domain-containing protein